MRTKDSITAKAKQHELDLQYAKQSYIDSNSSKPSYSFGPKPTIAIIFGTIVITTLFIDYYMPGKVKLNTNGSIYNKKNEVIEEIIDVIPKIIVPVKSVINDQITPEIENIPEILGNP